MEIFNSELARSVLLDNAPTVKFIMNQNAVAFFPSTQQHCDIKIYGLSYEHNYKGNAVAGLFAADKVEIRFHTAFSDRRISTIWSSVCSMPAFERLSVGILYYQGRALL